MFTYYESDDFDVNSLYLAASEGDGRLEQDEWMILKR